MPSGPGLRNALVKMGAGPEGERRVVWTSLREEPVLVSQSSKERDPAEYVVYQNETARTPSYR